MMDLLFLLVVVGFFAGAIAYVEGCERLVIKMVLDYWLGGSSRSRSSSTFSTSCFIPIASEEFP